MLYAFLTSSNFNKKLKKHKMKRKTILLSVLLLSTLVLGQIGIGTANPNASAILDLDVTSLVSGNKGFLDSRVALVSRTDVTYNSKSCNRIIGV